MRALDIIKALPIDDKLRLQVVNQYDYFTPSQKLAMDRLAWQTYFTLYEERLQENLGMQFENAKAGKEKVGDDFYRRALKKTDDEMTHDFKESISKHDLSVARAAMEKIVAEIQAAKKAKN